MTEVQLAKITVEIDRLIQKIKELEAEASCSEDKFDASWRQSGSELAGPPASIEINRNMAKQLRRKAGFLENVRNGKIGPEKLATLQQNILIVDQQIMALSSSKVAMYGEIVDLQYLEEVIK